MLRKHIMMIERNRIEKLPFYGWNCITLNIKDREGDVYLIIKDEKVMSYFLKLLIYELRSTDGVNGTANRLRHAIIKEEKLNFQVKNGTINKVQLKNLKAKID